MSNKQGFRCNCQGCDGTPNYPCRAAEENEEDRIAFDAFRARVKELEEAMPTVQQMRNLAHSFDGGGMLGCARGAWAIADRIEKVMKK